MGKVGKGEGKERERARRTWSHIPALLINMILRWMFFTNMLWVQEFWGDEEMNNGGTNRL